MAKTKTKTGFKKGHKHGRGRPKVLLPEVQRAIDMNRNVVRVMIMEELEVLKCGVPRIRQIIAECLDRAGNEGDAQKLKILLELALGKMVDDPPEFPVDDDEKILILEYRRRKALKNGSA